MGARPTVVFGPFVGEFGWEHSYWRAWVDQMCRTRFSRWWRIAISFPGRRLFYPSVDEFRQLPQWFLGLQYVGRNYITDDWWIAKGERPAARDAAERALRECTRDLPHGTRVFCPFRLNTDGPRIFGVMSLSPFRYAQPVPIPVSEQRFSLLSPTEDGDRLFTQRCGDVRDAVAVFPRNRPRRPDKNWPVSRYRQLIERLHAIQPDRAILIVGSPDGAYPTTAFPDYCVDLVGVPDEVRLDVQVAALKRTRVAVGAASGGMLMAMSAGCSVVQWGEPHSQNKNFEHNVFSMDQIYLQDEDPGVDDVLQLVVGYLDGAIRGAAVFPAERRRSKENPHLEKRSLIGAIVFKLMYYMSWIYVVTSRSARVPSGRS